MNIWKESGGRPKGNPPERQNKLRPRLLGQEFQRCQHVALGRTMRVSETHTHGSGRGDSQIRIKLPPAPHPERESSGHKGQL